MIIKLQDSGQGNLPEGRQLLRVKAVTPFRDKDLRIRYENEDGESAVDTHFLTRKDGSTNTVGVDILGYQARRLMNDDTLAGDFDVSQLEGKYVYADVKKAQVPNTRKPGEFFTNYEFKDFEATSDKFEHDTTINADDLLEELDY